MNFRPLAREDFALLSQWLSEPHVERWWREEHQPAVIEAAYGPAVDGLDPTEVFVVERDGVPIGLVQRCRLNDHPEWQQVLAPAATPPDAVTLDYLIGTPALIGRGVGGEMIERFVEDTWERHPDIAAVVVSVQQDNRRSWRALEKAGFERAWAGTLDSPDPSDAGPSYVYVRYRAER